MRELTQMEAQHVDGAWRLKNAFRFDVLKVAIFGLGAFCTGGPVGLGVFLCGVTAYEGVHNLNDLYGFDALPRG